MLIVYMFYHRICWFGFFCWKSCQLLSYKSDTCNRCFFQSVHVQPLETVLVRTNNKCILRNADKYKSMNTTQINKRPLQYNYAW